MSSLSPKLLRLCALADADDADAARHLWRYACRLNDEGLKARAARHLWRLGAWAGEVSARARRGAVRQENNDIAWAFGGDGVGATPHRFVVVMDGGGYTASGVLSSALPFWVVRDGLRRLSSGEDPDLLDLVAPPCWLDDADDAGTLRTLRWAMEQVGAEVLARDVLLASREAVADVVEMKGWLQQVTRASHSLIQRWSVFRNERMALQGMFSQMTALAVRDHRAYVAHVGMGGVYRLRGGEVTALTQPHSVGQALRRSGAIHHNQPDRPDYERICARALGLGSWQDPDLLSFALDPDDRFLLYTPGLRAALGEPQIFDIWRSASAHQAGEALMDAALVTGADDNFGCACLDVTSPASTAALAEG